MKATLMAQRQTVWTTLGLGTATAIGLLGAGCSVEDTPQDPALEMTSTVKAAPSDGSVGTLPAATAQSGEGEGGVAIAQAAADPVIYLSALAIAEAHVIAARDAYEAGRTEAAGEMFAHPVSEVLAEMQPVFEARSVADFSDLFLDASDAAYSGADVPVIDNHAMKIIAALRNAQAGAPDDGREDSAIWAGVVADQIDRAADMYAIASETDAYEPYLDGYGFMRAAESAFSEHAEAISAALPDMKVLIQRALSELEAAYPSALRPDALYVKPAALKGMSSEVQLALSASRG